MGKLRTEYFNGLTTNKIRIERQIGRKVRKRK
jgi:hypothetical protein